MSAQSIAVPSLKTYRFRTTRAFKALDDGTHKKWVLVVAARDLPRELPLDANARVPNVIKNPTCKEMRETLLTRPELFQIFNGGMICTATAVDVRQEGNEQWVEAAFDQEQLQGIVNGGHTYGCLLHVIHDHPVYAENLSLQAVLAKKDKSGEHSELAPLVEDADKLAERIARARERALVQLELVAPVSDPDLLAQVARARNLSQSVDQTALQNLAGKYETMKKVLWEAPAFGQSFVERVVWKTNQEVPEDSVEVPVKTLIHLLALMNTRLYRPGAKVANEVYTRSGVVIREFGEAEGEDSAFYDRLTEILPEFIRLYDHIYLTLPETDPSFPWADGKPTIDRKRRRKPFTTPLLARTCSSKVSGAFVWPVFSAFRLLLEEDQESGALRFKTDPIELFEQKKAELSSTIRTTFENQGRVVQQVGKATDAWIRLEGQIQMEMLIRDRIRAS
jgi:hypothetical protein